MHCRAQLTQYLFLSRIHYLFHDFRVLPFVLALKQAFRGPVICCGSDMLLAAELAHIQHRKARPTYTCCMATCCVASTFQAALSFRSAEQSRYVVDNHLFCNVKSDDIKPRSDCEGINDNRVLKEGSGPLLTCSESWNQNALLPPPRAVGSVDAASPQPPRQDISRTGVYHTPIRGSGTARATGGHAGGAGPPPNDGRQSDLAPYSSDRAIHQIRLGA